MEQFNKKPKERRKIVSLVIFLIILGIFVYWAATEVNQWWQVRKEYIEMGIASDKFPFRMYTERELVDKGLWSGESPALNAVPTRTTPEETYAIFRQALIDEDLHKAVECFVENKREMVYKGLGDVLKDKKLKAEMLNDLPEKLEDTYIYNEDITKRNLDNASSTAYYYVLKSDPTREAQTMTFEKDWDGNWKIEDL